MANPKQRLDDTMRAKALAMASEGHRLKEIRDALSIDSHVWYDERRDWPEWARKFDEARLTGMHELVDELLEVSQSEPDVQRARLYSDNVRWMASKLVPATYGDRVEMNVTGQVDLVAAMAEAKARLTPSVTVDATYVLPGESARSADALPDSNGEASACDSESVEAESDALEAPAADPAVDPFS